MSLPFSSLFFFNDTATTEIYTLSLHDALPISLVFERTQRFREVGSGLLLAGNAVKALEKLGLADVLQTIAAPLLFSRLRDRKSTRLNSSHQIISYAVFCLKKKKRTRGSYKRTT